MEDLKKTKPKYRVVRYSNSGSSPLLRDNSGEGTSENNNETSTNDNPTSPSNDDREEGQDEQIVSDSEYAMETSQ